MADDKVRIQRTYPLPVYNYRVIVSGNGTSEEIGFSEVSGLTIESEPVIYAHGLSFLMGRHIIPGRARPVRITMKKGIVKSASQGLSDWFSTAINSSTATRRTIDIDLCDESGNSLIRWTVRNALPIKLDAPTFDASSNDVAINVLELIADELQINYDPA